MEKIPIRPSKYEIDALRVFLETRSIAIVSDDIRAFVEQYLPDLKHKLPPKIEVLPSLHGGHLS
jgi:hypothetical protein